MKLYDDGEAEHALIGALTGVEAGADKGFLVGAMGHALKGNLVGIEVDEDEGFLVGEMGHTLKGNIVDRAIGTGVGALLGVAVGADEGSGDGAGVGALLDVAVGADESYPSHITMNILNDDILSQPTVFVLCDGLKFIKLQLASNLYQFGGSQMTFLSRHKSHTYF